MKAIECYTEGLNNVTEENELKLTLLSNRAQSYIKLERFRDAEIDCENALKIDKENLKSLQRKSVSLYYQKKLKEAQICLNETLKKFEDVETKSLLLKVNEEINKIKKEMMEKIDIGKGIMGEDRYILKVIDVSREENKKEKENKDSKKLYDKKEEKIVKEIIDEKKVKKDLEYFLEEGEDINKLNELD